MTQEIKFKCNECNHTNHHRCKYGDLVCDHCGNHQSASGHTHNFCYCGWNQSNFDPMDAGESWDGDY